MSRSSSSASSPLLGALRRERSSGPACAGVKPGSSSSMRAPPSGDSRRSHPAAVGVGDRAHDREPEAGAAGARGCARSRCGGSGRTTRSRSSAGIPGPSSSTRKRIRSPGASSHAQPHEARVGARCARSRWRSGCAAPARGGRGRRGACPSGTSLELEAPVGDQAHAVPQLRDEGGAARSARPAGTRFARSSRAAAGRRRGG